MGQAKIKHDFRRHGDHDPEHRGAGRRYLDPLAPSQNARGLASAKSKLFASFQAGVRSATEQISNPPILPDLLGQLVTSATRLLKSVGRFRDVTYKSSGDFQTSEEVRDIIPIPRDFKR